MLKMHSNPAPDCILLTITARWSIGKIRPREEAYFRFFNGESELTQLI